MRAKSTEKSLLVKHGSTVLDMILNRPYAFCVDLHAFEGWLPYPVRFDFFRVAVTLTSVFIVEVMVVMEASSCLMVTEMT